jgi:hypothetical protein
MPGHRLLTAFMLAALAAPVAQAAAQPITIVNPSFEDPVLGDGGFTPSAIGWTVVGAGTFNPTSGQFSGSVPDGQNVAYVSAGGSLSQTLTALLMPSTTYTLSYYAGNRLDFPFPSYLVQLLAGGTVLASDGSLSPGEGLFAQGSVVYTSGAADPLVGQPLGIRVTSTGDQPNFDAFALVATPAGPNVVIPEPSTVVLLATGLLTLGGTALRRRRARG